MSKLTGTPLFGAAYYSEYLPSGRDPALDVAMMLDAHINVIRIAESTWSTLEPQPGVFDFHHVDRVLDAVAGTGISVIVGTPTYAFPSWLVADYPEVIAETPQGRPQYGRRQIMNISDPAFRWHAERVIRGLTEHVAGHLSVIGFQVDNETWYYDVASRDVQRAFVRHLHQQFGGDLEALNRAFGLAYWSNSIHSWADFPDLRGTVNASLATAFDAFRRDMVRDYLDWQARLVREYARPDQFVTHNFDLDWAPGHSYGVKPGTDHFQCASVLDVAGIDIYHPSASRLTGREIAFGGDLARSLKNERYLVLETQAQGQTGWLPFPGQLRLQGHSHFASGAAGVMYWHWHSLHNSLESYWKGLLSQDMQPNPVYDEAGRLGAELERIGPRIRGMRKDNRVALMVSNEALSALRWFQIETGWPEQLAPGGLSYNDVVRWLYDALFDLNLECDLVSPGTENLSDYRLVVAPALYSCSQGTIDRLRAYVAGGGALLASFRSFIADQHARVWDDSLPHGMTDVFGLRHQMDTRPEGISVVPCEGVSEWAGSLSGELLAARSCMELIATDGAQPLAHYADSPWGSGPAVTANRHGDGHAYYLATMTSSELLRALLEWVARDLDLWEWPQELSGKVTVRRLERGEAELIYLLNYSPSRIAVALPLATRSLLDPCELAATEPIELAPWGVEILETGPGA